MKITDFRAWLKKRQDARRLKQAEKAFNKSLPRRSLAQIYRDSDN